MHYPNWYVPFLTAPMVIALVAVLHVVVSHYAVGGGFFLAIEAAHAYRTKNTAYLDYLKDHAWFFILVTVVYGAITGAGIWWTIGLASPLATETLIHAFVFGWAMEYVTFILEIVSAFVFFYYWGRLDPKTHVIIGWIYAGAAWVSLVLITAITAYMLNPGAWPAHRGFWTGILNPQLLPQVLSRTGGSFLLASLYVYLHASFRAKDTQLREMIARRSTRPALLGAVLIMLGGAGWLLFLPESARAALQAASLLNVMMVLIFAITAGVFVMLYLGPYRNPGWLSPGFAILLFSFGLAAVAVGEQIREAVRKPYVIYNVVMSNQVLPEEIPALRESGYLKGGTWTRAWVAERFPGVEIDIPEPGIPPSIESKAVQPTTVQPSWAVRQGVGRTLYQYHCASCHALDAGFSPLAQLIRGWTPEMVGALVREPEKAHFFMPPWCGTGAEAFMLTEYLVSITPPHPPGMYYGNGSSR